jgi:glycosyltransferase involved in cell wall biosynthesis
MAIPSRAESLPYVILEAAAAAQPLIATDVGGIKEIYGPRHAPRLIPPNDPTILADAISRTLAMPEAARRAEATDLANYVRANFCLDTMIDSVLDAYRSTLARRFG